MEFKYSCIGDNSQENRDWLEKVGYEQVNKLSCPCRKIITYPQGVYTLTPISITNRKDVIDCTNNPQLFQAVSAISKTDIGKHYINNHTGQWRKCTYEMATDENIDWSDWTEASLDELQEHFK